MCGNHLTPEAFAPSHEWKHWWASTANVWILGPIELWSPSFRATETHALAAANQQKNDRLKAAFGIATDYVDGSSFHPERKEREKEKREQERLEKEKQQKYV